MTFFRKLTIFLILTIIVSSIGCTKKETPKEEKVTHSTEKKEENAHEEDSDVVTMDPERQKTAGIMTMKVSAEFISLPLSATAVIEVNADKVSKISAKTLGKIFEINANQGDKVKKNQILAYFESPEVFQNFSEYNKAKSKVELAKKNLKREETLFEKKVSPEKDLLKARAELEEAEAELKFAIEKMRLLDIDISKIDEGTNKNHRFLIPISSPINGTIVEKSVTQGETVNPEKVLFTIADLSSLWVTIDIPEKEISKLKTGMSVNVSVDAFPKKTFKGKISYITDILDQHTRTAKARVTLDNSSGLLKPGMFANVIIESFKTDTIKKSIVIPQNALVIDGEESFVFVKTDNDKFERRKVKIGITSEKNVEIIEGLKEGEIVVAKGSFILKSELKKEELSEGHHHD